MAAQRRAGRLSHLRGDRPEQAGAQKAPGLLEHLRPQGPGAWAARRPRARQPDGHPEGGRGLASVQLHHLPLLHPQRVLRSRLSRNDQVRTDTGCPGSGGAGHQLDDAVRRAGRAVPERVRRARHDLRWIVVTFPTVWAHIIGQLLKFMGPDRIVFGSDSPWYGGPQWQIDAFWRFQIPEEIQERWGYPALTEASRRKILGLNSAGLYKLPGASEASAHGVYKPVPQNFESQIPNSLLTLLEYQGVADDQFSKMRKQYVERGGGRSKTRYGGLRTKA